MRRYSRLRKAELIDLLNRNRNNILDEEVPDIGAPVLRPTRYEPASQPNTRTDERKKEIRELEEMLGLRKPPKMRGTDIPAIKVTDLEEVEREMKINRIKEINRRRDQFTVTQTASALRGFVRQIRIVGVERYGPREFMQSARAEVLRLMRENRQTRVMLMLNSEMVRQELFSEESEILEAHFQTEVIENLEATDESEVFDVMVNTIEERIQNFNQRGSNWRFQRVLSLDVQLSDYIPLRGSSYIALPRFITNKKAVINIQNRDNECFKWSILRHLHPTENHPEGVSSLREFENDLNFRGIQFPMKLTDIPRFEKQNQGISVNVFGVEGRKIYPLRFSKKRSADKFIIHNR